MLAIILWIFSLIIWIINLILRIRLPARNSAENGFHILVAVLFIIISIVNIVGRAINLNSDASPETIETVKVYSIEDTTQEEYYITDTIY